MIIDLHVTNPTDHTRTQWVLYGSTEEHNVFLKLPRSWVNTVYITVPPGPNDQIIKVDTEAGPDKNLGFLSDVVAKTLGLGLQSFKPYLIINGNRHYFHFGSVTDFNGDFSVAIWFLKGDGIIARLWTYYGRQDNIMRFEMLYFSESLSDLRKHYKISMGVNADSVAIVSRGKDYNNLIDDLLIDGQGNRLLGSFLFFKGVFSSKDTHNQMGTIMAEYTYPLYALHEWKWWGPWKKKPIPISNKEFDRQQRNKVSQRWQDPLTFPGYILNKRSGDAGAQGGFGTWQHLPTIGAKRSEQMLLDQFITGQEACRPMHFFEQNGEELNLDNHPNLVSWNELPHYNKVVSPDRLRRTHTGKLNSGFDWFGHDLQHYGNIWLAEDVMLNGSFASMFELRMKSIHLQSGLTLPSKKPRWSTNGSLGGRAAGRVLLSVVYNWMATGDEKLLKHIAKRFNEVMIHEFTAQKSPGPLHVSRVICNDDRVFGRDKCGWMVWEDSLMVMGLDALSKAFSDIGLTSEASECAVIVKKLAITVTSHGWHPTRDIIAKMILWNLATRTQPPLTLAEWNDESKAVLALGTDFGHWARPCLKIASRDGLQRAIDLLKVLGNETDNPSRHTYMGTQ